MISRKSIVIAIILAAAMIALIVYEVAKCNEVNRRNTPTEDITEGL